jgi:hypothetical protein
MALSIGTALYYPYIHLRDVNDIKSALLYWDRVRRIVPDSVSDGPYVHGDQEEAQRLMDCGPCGERLLQHNGGYYATLLKTSLAKVFRLSLTLSWIDHK